MKPRAHKVKDTVNHFYKRIEVHLNLQDSDYSTLYKNFGWKCQLVRDPMVLRFVMETYVPCLRDHG